MYLSLCEEHQKEIEYFCVECKIYLCGRCSNTHINKFREHTSYHIDDIKKKDSNNNNNNNGDEKSNELYSRGTIGFTDINKRIKDMWASVRLASQTITSLKQTESQITDQFNKLVEQLRNEEMKLKKPIHEGLEQVRTRATNDLRLLIDVTCHTTAVNAGDKEAKEAKNRVLREKMNDLLTTLKVEDICALLDREVEKLVQSKFDKNSLDISLDSKILDLINSHNQKYYYNSNNDNSNNYILKLVVPEELENEVAKVLSGIKLKHVVSPFTLKNNFVQKQYLLSTTNFPSPSIKTFDVYNNFQEVNSIQSQWNVKSTTSAIVKVGDHIYCFNKEVVCKYNYVEKKVLDSIKIEYEKSYKEHRFTAAYGGGDLIYVIGLNRIFTFNVITNEFQLVASKFRPKLDYPQLAFFYNSQLHIFKTGCTAISVFDPITKKLVENEFSKTHLYPQSICTDGKGNVYIHELEKFHVVNIISKSITKLNHIPNKPITDQLSMVYNELTKEIYLIGGYWGTFVYSIHDNQWSQLKTREDKQDRYGYGSIMFLN